MTEHTILPLKPNPGMPPRQPIPMPIQDLKAAGRFQSDPASARVIVARLVAFGGAALLTAGGSYEMTQVVAIGGVTYLEGIMTAVFAVTFGWISLAASQAIAGLIIPPARHLRPTRLGGQLASRTALVMPIYHEDPVRTTAALEVMARGLERIGEAKAFEVVLVSDSTDADAWLRETLAVDRLHSLLGGIMPVWYRRRWANTAKKAGNVKDFVEQWGGRYDHFIILDADSLMLPATLVTLVQNMEADERLGILQSVPTLAGGQSLFARLQQFAGRIHGPIVSRGLAAWQGSDGNYWGHNAIIRTSAFAACCGLPDLPGKKPFGGPVLSHDFVEAALMRRGGWRVEMTPRLEGSWEESPPSLIDAAVRDRRWAQGNLQHMRVIAARGLRWPSRVHMAVGVMSYAASPLWLLLIALGFALSLQARLIRPEYFTDQFQLFPTWPLFDSERMIRLFALTLVVLLLPKLIGYMRALFTPALRQGCGGGVRLTASVLAEIFISGLFAPIMMAIHTRQIYEIFAGRDAGWAAQRRDAGETRWGDAWNRHHWHMTFGVILVVAAWYLSPAILAWLSPTLAGLLLAVPLSHASGSMMIGRALRRAGLLLIPEETRPDPIFAERELAMSATPALPQSSMIALATDADLRLIHFRWTSSAPWRRGDPDAAHLTASEKLSEAHTLDEALGWLEPRERIHIAGHQAMAEQLAGLSGGGGKSPVADEPDSADDRQAMVDFSAGQAQMRSPAA